MSARWKAVGAVGLLVSNADARNGLLRRYRNLTDMRVDGFKLSSGPLEAESGPGLHPGRRRRARGVGRYRGRAGVAGPATRGGLGVGVRLAPADVEADCIGYIRAYR